jgi:hypothetical protein
MNSATGQADVTFKAAFNAENREVTVVRHMHAGISGPFGDYPADDLDAAERALFDAGYLIASTWGELNVNGSRWCLLALMV